jgi:V/A-type H+/Na+-transporting ATPase subunit D
MAELHGIPPGRAGRLWLESRVAAGRSAADLLDRRLRLLLGEQERFRLLEERTGQRWRGAWRRADEWALRATFLAGPRELAACAPDGAADVGIAWDSVMGVRYPVEASCRPAQLSTQDRGPGSAALQATITAVTEAIQAAADHAAAAAARATIEAEVAANRRRLRAITHRRLPQLETALSALRRGMEETERAETLRLRWAADRRDGRGAAAW